MLLFVLMLLIFIVTVYFNLRFLRRGLVVIFVTQVVSMEFRTANFLLLCFQLT